MANGADAPVHHAVPAIAHASQIGIAHDAFASDGALVFVHFMPGAVAAMEFAARVVAIRTIGRAAAAMAPDQMGSMATIPIGTAFSEGAAVASAVGRPLAVVRSGPSVVGIVPAVLGAATCHGAGVAPRFPRAIVHFGGMAPRMAFR